MDWLNFHHLLYFRAVAREGSVTAAARVLHLSPSTVSAQVQALEESLGEELLVRRGRRLELTESGRLVAEYADEVHDLGRELLNAVRGERSERPVELAVGLAHVVPKLVAHRLLQPALALGEAVQVRVVEDRHDELLGRLARHELDVVLSDSPVASGSALRLYNHPLGESGVTVFGTAELARKHGKAFPAGLDGAPMLMPGADTASRRALALWLDDRDLRPRVVGEFEDTALLKVFGQESAGLFTAPSVIEAEVCRQYRVRALGELEGLRERFHAISAERRVKHPGVLALAEAARTDLFAGG